MHGTGTSGAIGPVPVPAQAPSCPGAGHVRQGPQAGSTHVQPHPESHLPEPDDVKAAATQERVWTGPFHATTALCAETARHQHFHLPVPILGRRIRMTAECLQMSRLSHFKPEEGWLINTSLISGKMLSPSAGRLQGQPGSSFLLHSHERWPELLPYVAVYGFGMG